MISSIVNAIKAVFGLVEDMSHETTDVVPAIHEFNNTLLAKAIEYRKESYADAGVTQEDIDKIRSDYAKLREERRKRR